MKNILGFFEIPSSNLNRLLEKIIPDEIYNLAAIEIVSFLKRVSKNESIEALVLCFCSRTSILLG